MAVVDAAAELFSREVHASAPPGLPKLRALCEAWVSYLERDVLPGGCFFTTTASEVDGRPGPVRDAVLGLTELWHRDLRLQIRLAADLPPGTDPDRLLYDIASVMPALNLFRQLHRDPKAAAQARAALRRLLG
ncbi:TetR family transcriptional regulator C-terminal domain-containing protein [Amycolatopsis sp. NPDC051758]|uniref:TetR family transcriptional regulator C-terminal domain-containing protein n=1 Tax=Amycolatopsis sp. NPDC051758 TaxID=3363935 RepID=UPI0037ACA4E9